MVWLGVLRPRVFWPPSRGFDSPHIFDEDSNISVGSSVYEVAVKRPVKADYTIGRIEIMPTVATTLASVLSGTARSSFSQYTGLPTCYGGPSCEW